MSSPDNAGAASVPPNAPPRASQATQSLSTESVDRKKRRTLKLRPNAQEQRPPVNPPDGFTKWLCGQRDQNDETGDLARDYIQDCRIEGRDFNAAELARRIYDTHTAWESFKDALGEYLLARSVKPS